MVFHQAEGMHPPVCLLAGSGQCFDEIVAVRPRACHAGLKSSHPQPRAGRRPPAISAKRISSASSPWRPERICFPSGLKTIEQPMHFLPRQGPDVIGPTLLAAAIQTRNSRATGE